MTTIVSTDIAGDVKPCFASSPVVGLTVRSNGEEPVKVLTPDGQMFDALLPYSNLDDHIPAFADTGTAGALPVGKYAAYTYVYAATTSYPNVENAVSIGGSLAPRGNPNRQAAHQVDGAGHGIAISVPQSDRPDIDEIWIFRTTWFDTADEASVQAIAGQAFYLGKVANDPTAAPDPVTYTDNSEADGTDLVEIDNFSVPCFKYCVYDEPYWWGWGNDPLSLQVDFDTDGNITIVDPDRKWFVGRQEQLVRLEGVTEGGIDGKGTFLFMWKTNTTAHAGAYNATFGFAEDVAIGSSGTNKRMVVQGPSSTLYRSKPNNPFAWGETEYFGSVRVPSVFALKVGGGQGTGIAVVPNLPVLLLSTEYPAGAYTLDLRQAGTDAFTNSRRTISKFYSISSHHSQFAATGPDGQLVLWGWDAKNYCILECDGSSIRPVSGPISKTLRLMSTDRSRQQLAHGAHDARNGLNCMWLPTLNSLSLVNLLVAQHAPSQQWFIHDEHDVLCSAQFQDGDSNLNKIFVGTQSGLLGEAFAEGKYCDWVKSDTPLTGNVSSATSTVVTMESEFVILEDEPAYVGTWCLLTDGNGENEQWARIASCNVATNEITFDLIYSRVGGSAEEFNPVPSEGWKLYIGLLEVRAIKYFDMQAPSSDKKLDEIWFTIANVDTDLAVIGQGSTFLRYYRDRSTVPYPPKSDGLLGIPLTRVNFPEGTATDAWLAAAPPSDRIKTFGIEILDRSYNAWRMYNWTLKPRQ